LKKKKKRNPPVNLNSKMVDRRLMRRDQAGLPKPDMASLLASASGA